MPKTPLRGIYNSIRHCHRYERPNGNNDSYANQKTCYPHQNQNSKTGCHEHSSFDQTRLRDSSCQAQLNDLRLDTRLQEECTMKASERTQADLQDSQGQVFILTRPSLDAKVGVGLSSPQEVDNCPQDGQRCQMIQHEITADHHGDWNSLNVSGDRNTKGRWRLYLDNLSPRDISVVLNIRTIPMSCSGGVFIEERINNGPLIRWGTVCSGGIFDVDGSWNATAAANGH